MVAVLTTKSASCSDSCAVQGAGKGQVGAQVLGIALGQLVDHLVPLGVDVHKADVAARKPLGQAHVLDQSQGKDHAARADNGYLDCHLDLLLSRAIPRDALWAGTQACPTTVIVWHNKCAQSAVQRSERISIR